MANAPVEFSEDIFAAILERLAQGEGLVSICNDKDMPHRSSVFRWIDGDTALRDRYVRARELQADTLAEEIITIADDGSRDYKKDADGREMPDHDHIARSRLRVDARKWAASKLAPKKYGDKVEHALTGADGGPVQNVTRIELVAVSAKPRAEPPDDNASNPAS